MSQFRVTIPEGTLEWDDGEWAGTPHLVADALALIDAGETVYGTPTGPQVRAGGRTPTTALCTALRVIEDREALRTDGPRRPAQWEGDVPAFDVPDGAVS